MAGRFSSYERDEIYTYTAYILIAVNPYKRIDLYSEDMIKKVME